MPWQQWDLRKPRVSLLPPERRDKGRHATSPVHHGILGDTVVVTSLI